MAFLRFTFFVLLSFLLGQSALKKKLSKSFVESFWKLPYFMIQISFNLAIWTGLSPAFLPHSMERHGHVKLLLFKQLLINIKISFSWMNMYLSKLLFPTEPKNSEGGVLQISPHTITLKSNMFDSWLHADQVKFSARQSLDVYLLSNRKLRKMWTDLKRCNCA